MLNMKQSTLSQRKRKNSIPYAELFGLCEEKKINIHWLLTGKGPVSFGNLVDDREFNEIIRFLIQYPLQIRFFIEYIKYFKESGIVDEEWLSDLLIDIIKTTK